MNNPIIENELSNKISQLSADNNYISSNIEESSAAHIAEYLYKSMVAYQTNLAESDDIAMTLVHFGALTTILVDSIGYIGNNLVVFHGKDMYGNPLELI